MKELTPEAYAELRAYVRNNWKYVELKNEENQTLIRVGEGPKLSITIEGSRIKYVMNVKGEDFPSLPVTVAKVELYKEASGGVLLASEDIESKTLFTEEDLLVLTLELHLPGEEG